METVGHELKADPVGREFLAKGDGSGNVTADRKSKGGKTAGGLDVFRRGGDMRIVQREQRASVTEGCAFLGEAPRVVADAVLARLQARAKKENSHAGKGTKNGERRAKNGKASKFVTSSF
jgi:hypothetical protein